ncbi:MAG TPA: Ig-like domain-containing protein [Verrucomicrobiae bacterium]|nr:Ig-like domain-containing protein [Verrucomicrobiae bacterium]
MKKTLPLCRTITLLGAALTGLLSVCAARAQDDVVFYSVSKEESFVQADATTVSPAPGSRFLFSANLQAVDTDLVFVVTMDRPGGMFPTPLTEDDPEFYLEQAFGSQSAMDSAYPNGTYQLNVIEGDGDSPSLTLSLTGNQYPTTPRIANFTAAQDIDPAADFTLTWDAFVGGTANDFIQLRIEDDMGNTFFESGPPDDPSALNGTDVSVVIPADMLEGGKTYQATLLFARVLSRDTTSYAGALGVSAYLRQTAFTMHTSGSSPDTTPPFMFMTQPVNNANNVPVNSPVIFTFSEAMRTNHSVTWSGNVTAANFSYAWTASTTLTCTYNANLPTNATINWTLNTSSFLDLAGNPLAPFNTTGSFTTGSGTGCTAQTNGFSITKSADYVQTSDAAPSLSPDPGATFGASLFPPAGSSITGATVTLPNATVKTLTSFFGTFFFFESFSSVAELDAAYPSGNYTATVQRSAGGSQSAVVSLPTTAWPPVPRISNFTAAQNINPAASFVLNWDSFSGAGAPSGLSLTIWDGANTIFQTTDPCTGPTVPATSTLITIPANTFSAGKTYTGRLTFSNTTGFDTNSIPGIFVSALLSRTTEFTLTTIGGTQPTPPRFTQVSIAGNGALQFQLSGPTNAPITVDVSTNLTAWTLLFTTNVSSGTVQFQDPSPATLPQRFYRARAQ